MEDILKTIENAGCLDFVQAAGKRALADMESARPEMYALLTDEARRSLADDFKARVELIYYQVLLQEARKILQKADPVSLLTGKPDPESKKKAAEELASVNNGDIESFLHEKYPLLSEYRACICRNYTDSFSAFFDAVLEKKEEIEERFLERRTIRKILGLSTGGADLHRHGKCVIGVKTDAGDFYYKPHDCGTDAFYHEIVSRWFSDCTAAADVISGDGYGFVSCLVREDLRKEEQIPEYYYHFGILAALIHGLGGTDMHFENIMAVGDRPSAVDIETILGLPDARTEEMRAENVSGKAYAESLIRTCILPFRVYKGPIVSPLYYREETSSNLPVFAGKKHTVEGYEEEFIRGFHEGYCRMLSHRDEMILMLQAQKNAVVRVLIRNTRFYAILRNRLFLPESLSGKEERRQVYSALRSPYKGNPEKDRDFSEYEWQCLLDCDIPYFCTALDSKDLCGEDPSQKVRKEYFRESPAGSAEHFLGRLSKEEERFETELIRHSFRHAATDVPKLPEEIMISGESPMKETVTEEIGNILEKLEKDVVHSTDGSPVWISTGQSIKGTINCGKLTNYAELGAFVAAAARCKALPHLQEKAASFAQALYSLLHTELQNAKTEWTASMGGGIPTGICSGIGGVLKNCLFMKQQGIKGADALADDVISLIAGNKLYEYNNPTLSEGTAGLVLALADTEPNERINTCIRICADRLLLEDLPKRDDSAYGCAGIGAALAAAYCSLMDDRYLKGAAEAFEKVFDDYDPKLKGWPDGEARLKFLAGKGPHEAGIYLCAEYAREKILQNKDLSKDTQFDIHRKAAILLTDLSETAKKTMTEEKKLTYLDTLEQGNALTVLALLKAEEEKGAGRVLDAMLQRKEKTGSFAVLPKGIRSTFDSSFFLGTTGIGYAMIRYLNQI